MTPKSDPAQELLSRARRALEPTRAEESRVLAALSHRLDGPAPLVDFPADAELLPRADAGAQTVWQALTRFSTHWIVGGVVIGSLGVGVGYSIGRSQGSPQRDEAPRLTPEPTPVPSVSPSVPQPAPSTLPVAAQSVPLRSRPGAGAAAAPAVPPRPARDPQTPAPQPSSSASLSGEVALLQQAQRALRDGRHLQALRLLDQLDREYPHGSLGEEREAAHVLTLCAAGLTAGAAARVRAFLRDRPGSVYAERIRANCGIDPDPDPSVDGSAP